MRLDRFVRKARDHFDPFEGLVGVVLGRESGGRRRIAVVASDNRVLLVTLRPEPAVEFAYPDLQVDVTCSEGSASIHLETPDAARTVERIVDVTGAQLLAEMIGRRAACGEAPVATSRIVLLPPVEQIETS